MSARDFFIEKLRFIHLIGGVVVIILLMFVASLASTYSSIYSMISHDSNWLVEHPMLATFGSFLGAVSMLSAMVAIIVGASILISTIGKIVCMFDED